MANFMNIANFLEGVINTQLAAARVTQGVWEWYNVLQRVMSQNRVTGTSTVFGPKVIAAGDNAIETVPVTVYGILIDNSQAAEDVLLTLGNATLTLGTTDPLGGVYFALRNTLAAYVIPTGVALSTQLDIGSTLGTQAGEAAGTASTTKPTVVMVYTK